MIKLNEDDFIKHITAPLDQNLEELAAAEAERLSAYFDALERRLGQGRSSLLQKGRLTTLFNKVAADTRNLILSGFTITSSETLRAPALKRLEFTEALHSFFKPVFRNDAIDQTNMGFIQTVGIGQRGSVTIPVMAIDSAVLKALEGHDITPILTGLQEIFSIGNHDMMHHLTNTYLNSSVAQLSSPPIYSKRLRDFMGARLRGADEAPESYESWAILSHAATWEETRKSGGEEELSAITGQFFDALATLDRALEKNGAGPRQRTKITDYFSTLACSGLMRVCPFNSPVMERAVNTAATLSPDPDRHYAAFLRRHLNDKGEILPAEDRGAFVKVFAAHIRNPDQILGENWKDIGTLIAHFNEIAVQWGMEPVETAQVSPYYLWAEVAHSPTAEKTKKIHDTIHDFSEVFDRNGLIRDGLPEAARPDLDSLENEIAARTAKIFCRDPDLRAQHSDLIHSAAHSLAILWQEKIELFAVRNKEAGAPKRPLFIETLANYQAQGYPLLPPGKDGLSQAALKRLELMENAPEIAYLLSPYADSERLRGLKDVARDTDYGVISILSRS